MPTIPSDFTVTYADRSATMELPDNSIRYLLQYGFAQSLQDARAGSAKDVRETAKACRAGGDGFDKALAKWNRLCKAAGVGEGFDFADDESVAHVAAEKESADMDARLAAIISGEIGTGVGGVRLDPIDRTMRQIAEREIREALRVAKMASPTGAAMTELVAGHIGENADRLREEAEAELAKTRASAATAAGLVAKLKAKVA